MNLVTWGWGQDRAYAEVQCARQALARERLTLSDLPAANGDIGRWARAVAECVQRGSCCGGVVFCQDPALVCCIANKLPGVRAAPVTTIAQAAQAMLSLGANLLAVQMPGRTFFEVRQILRQFCNGAARACPDGVACTLRELDGHAHR
jgi:ribose 5-phosphate isomerase RpiB